MKTTTSQFTRAALRQERKRHWALAAHYWDMAATVAKQPARRAGYVLRQLACDIIDLARQADWEAERESWQQFRKSLPWNKK